MARSSRSAAPFRGMAKLARPPGGAAPADQAGARKPPVPMLRRQAAYARIDSFKHRIPDVISFAGHRRSGALRGDASTPMAGSKRRPFVAGDTCGNGRPYGERAF